MIGDVGRMTRRVAAEATIFQEWLRAALTPRQAPRLPRRKRSPKGPDRRQRRGARRRLARVEARRQDFERQFRAIFQELEPMGTPFLDLLREGARP